MEFERLEGEEGLEVHEAMVLLLSRMDAHPHEFASNDHGHQGGRWQQYYQPYKSCWNRLEKRLFTERMREIQMGYMKKRMLAAITRK